jgi:hypothetical protein
LQKIISVSRRTDIPAFYGDWFLNKVSQGIAGYFNPFNKKPCFVSLKQEDVLCFVFWSKNFIPFMKHLKKLNELGYKFYFNYTINNYPDFFEKPKAKIEKLIDNIKKLSDDYSPFSINWRYDPIIISNKTDFDFHVDNFAFLASMLKGYVNRCYFSYVSLYNKVLNNFNKLKLKGIIVEDISIKTKIDFIKKIQNIANNFNITLYSCCNDFLVNENIKKAHCIDIDIIKNNFYTNKDLPDYKINPTRDQCGCTESIDIGVYDSCDNQCIYCYANNIYSIALKKIRKTEINSLFIGYSKKESDYFCQEINNNCLFKLNS